MKTILYEEKDLPALIEALRKGKAIAFPTDTVFGLACLSDNLEAINKVKEAKHRDASKPLPMMCYDIEMVKTVAYVNKAQQKIMEAFFPGALTLIFDKKENVPAYVTNGFSTIGIRIPDTPRILEIIKALQKPLLVTSANLSGEPSLKRWQDVYQSLNGRIDGILCLDAESKVASTIVDARQGLTILRQGLISKEDLKKVLEKNA